MSVAPDFQLGSQHSLRQSEFQPALILSTVKWYIVELLSLRTGFQLENGVLP